MTDAHPKGTSPSILEYTLKLSFVQNLCENEFSYLNVLLKSRAMTAVHPKGCLSNRFWKTLMPFSTKIDRRLPFFAKIER
jgi:hypothetical protein